MSEEEQYPVEVIGTDGEQFLDRVEERVLEGYRIVKGTSVLFLNPYKVRMAKPSGDAISPSTGVTQEDHDSVRFELVDAREAIEELQSEVLAGNETLMLNEKLITKITSDLEGEVAAREKAKVEISRLEDRVAELNSPVEVPVLGFVAEAPKPAPKPVAKAKAKGKKGATKS